MICEIMKHPEVLTLLLKRFTFSLKHNCYVKLHCKVDVPRTVNMKRCRYDLYALVNHHGHLKGGHYTTQVKSFENGEWYDFSDINVTKIRPAFGAGKNHVRSNSAYLLMYKKDIVNENFSIQRAHSSHSSEEAEGRQRKAETRCC
ncbi:ubiquitin carboxyl-terminal hydrolase 2-like [Cololabis saira]|uniref:ubiquitin carboxyl-terminal hydrolase 2-like n=1 Tax=Cololabis saira TaxID=129043 RepID=UPI002AD59683|nr:ubiquitin carboxyl-terminal hydrolase 2-like [Cololabis saira]